MRDRIVARRAVLRFSPGLNDGAFFSSGLRLRLLVLVLLALTPVLVNLTTNAIEAMTGTGGRLELRACARGRGPDRSVRIEVSDTGPGISSDALPRILEAFYTTKPEGTGLGLPIVRTLMEQQPGARIDLQSTLGQGTTFTLTFPAKE